MLLKHCTNGSSSGGADDFREQLVVLRFTTMRPGELRLLRWEYIEFQQNRIVFPNEVVKTRSRREVTLIDRVKTNLQNRRGRIFGIQRPTGYVFPVPGSKDGKRTAGLGDEAIKANSLSQRFRRLFLRCVKLGLVEKEKNGERVVPYSTRHTRITELFVEGNEHHIVMHDAGHRVPSTTERYKHLAGSHVADTIRRRSRVSGDGRTG